MEREDILGGLGRPFSYNASPPLLEYLETFFKLENDSRALMQYFYGHLNNTEIYY